MAVIDLKAQLAGASEFVAYALEQLAPSLGEADPMVVTGRRIKVALDAVPDGALLVTEEALATAFRRAWPFRRNTDSASTLSAALLLAALRAA